MNAPANLSDAAFRASVIGASEVAALFGCSPWLTHYELWQRKAGGIATPAFDEMSEDGVPADERIYWGIRMEATIIAAAKERFGYTDRDQVDRLDNGKGLGGHPDRRVMCPKRGPGILETKCVDWLERKKWGDEPPLHYLLQTQAYIGLDAAIWGDLLVLVGGNKLERFEYETRPVVYTEIEARVSAFWQSIRENKPPKPDYTRDRSTLGEVFADSSETVVDLRLDNRMPELAAEFLAAQTAEREAKAARQAAEAEILHKLGEAGIAMVEGFRVKVPTIAELPAKTITQDMVGRTIAGRAAHRRFYIKELEI